jgi:hypothetical protein
MSHGGLIDDLLTGSDDEEEDTSLTIDDMRLRHLLDDLDDENALSSTGLEVSPEENINDLISTLEMEDTDRLLFLESTPSSPPPPYLPLSPSAIASTTAPDASFNLITSSEQKNTLHFSSFSNAATIVTSSSSSSSSSSREPKQQQRINLIESFNQSQSFEEEEEENENEDNEQLLEWDTESSIIKETEEEHEEVNIVGDGCDVGQIKDRYFEIDQLLARNDRDISGDR